jgi:flagellar assembly protein FliH
MSTQLASPTTSKSPASGGPQRIERFNFSHAPGTGMSNDGPRQINLRELARQTTDPAENHATPAPDTKQVRAEAYQQGWDAAHANFETELQRERQTVSHALDEFAQDRFRYFRRVEKEVVELSIAIARRILHRESQIDPLVLQGAVRAVLDRVSDNSGSTMRMHPSRVAAWENWFAKHQSRQKPTLVADASLSTDQCVLETSMGTTDIGLQAQLQEIESGFCDLLATRSIEGK